MTSLRLSVLYFIEGNGDSEVKKTVNGFTLIAVLLCCSNANALGYLSRDCPQAGAKESFTMSWLDPEWLFTYSVLLKKTSTSPYYTYDVRKSGNTWEKTWRSGAGIHPYSPGNMSDYWAGVYGIHYYYNLDTKQVEERRRYVSKSCDILNWGVNNW